MLVLVSASMPAASCGGTANVRDATTDPGRDAGGADGRSGHDAGPGPCIGLRPEPAAWLAEPGPQRDPQPDAGPGDADAGAGCLPATCQGADEPVWALRDFQPQSCGDGATYGLDVFRGKVTVVALLAAW